MSNINDKRGEVQRDRILAFIKEHIAVFGFPPTIREIKVGLGYKTTSAPYYHLLKLHDEGRIIYTMGTARGIKVVQ